MLVCCGGVALARISSLLPDLMKEKIPNSAKSLSHLDFFLVTLHPHYA